MRVRKPAQIQRSRYVTTFFLMLAMTLGAVASTDFDRLLSALTQRWGNGPTAKFQQWRGLIASSSAASDTERLKRVNDFFNRQMLFVDDPENWAQPDYWATPMESLGKGAGDCEDYAIAKYFTLREAGVSPVKLRLIYVRAKTGSGDAAAFQAHMVLAYYPQPDAEPWVLDNLIGDIRPASKRPDLVPVFSFNSDGVFTASSKDGSPSAGTGRLSRWEDLLKRAVAEGFDLTPN